MIRYYVCDNDECGYTFEVEQDINDPSRKKKCPVCKKNSLYQDLSGIYVGVREVKTLGQIADLNTKKLGRYGLEDKEAKELENQKAEYDRKKSIIEQRNPGAKVPEFGQKSPIPETPEYVKKSIETLKGEDKVKRIDKYILEGK